MKNGTISRARFRTPNGDRGFRFVLFYCKGAARRSQFWGRILVLKMGPFCRPGLAKKCRPEWPKKSRPCARKWLPGPTRGLLAPARSSKIEAPCSSPAGPLEPQRPRQNLRQALVFLKPAPPPNCCRLHWCRAGASLHPARRTVRLFHCVVFGLATPSHVVAEAQWAPHLGGQPPSILRPLMASRCRY